MINAENLLLIIIIMGIEYSTKFPAYFGNSFQGSRERYKRRWIKFKPNYVHGSLQCEMFWEIENSTKVRIFMQKNVPLCIIAYSCRLCSDTVSIYKVCFYREICVR